MEAGAVAGSLVGRSRELERLEAALAGAAAGRGSTVLVAGEAGIGKTRLASEFAERARAGGATVLVGRCIDLVGTGLPYLPLVEALRPLRGSPALGGELRELQRLVPELAEPEALGDRHPDPQLRLFEEVLTVLERLGAEAPTVLVLEDLHWADASTLDLLAFLARAAPERRLLIVATYRRDELRPAEALHRQAVVLELGPLDLGEIEQLLGAPSDLAEAIYARSEGNPFFAEELLAAAARGEQTLPRVLREALLQRVAGLDVASRSVLRAAAAAGRDVPYGLLAAVVSLPEPELLESLRQAVEHGVLVPDQSARAFRFRHALLAEAVYATLLPGEREELHRRLAGALAAGPELGAGAAELAHHWAAAGRPAEALAASVRAAKEAEGVAGLAEALAQLERALELWELVPAAEDVAAIDLGAVLAWAAELADLTGRGPRAAELVRRAIDLVDEEAEPRRAGLLYERLGTYLLPWGDRDGGLAAFGRAVELVPAEPPSAERARVLSALANALMLSWRHADSRAACEEALEVADAIDDDRPALRALSVLAIDLCYLGSPAEALERALEARARARERGAPRDLAHSYVMLCEVLVATGRTSEAAQTALEGLALTRRLGLDRSYGILCAGYAAEAMLETGEWEQAEDVLAAALRSGATYWTHYPQLVRAELAIGRGDAEAAREHLEAGLQGAREPTSAARYARLLAELALLEGRSDDAARAVEEGLRATAASAASHQRTRLCAVGVRAEAERAVLAAVRRDEAAVAAARSRARRLVEAARASAGAAQAVSPDGPAWLVLAEAELGRAEGRTRPERWEAAVAEWDALERPCVAAYCRWRKAEALLGAGSRAEAVAPAREAHRVAERVGARALRRELELLAERARLDLAGLRAAEAHEGGAALGLTAREGEVLQLLARGYTNREIAAELVISVKTASVHVSHILGKLGVSSRLEAAALAHRLAPPPRGDR